MPRHFFTRISFATALAYSYLAVTTSDAMGSDSDLTAVSANRFLGSLGVNTHVDQGYDANKYLPALRYLGVRNIRDAQRNIAQHIMLHRQAGVLVDLLAFDVTSALAAARILADTGALLSIEGPNEPNNFQVTYKGRKGGGKSDSWEPVAELQRDLYETAKADPVLGRFPIFHVSEGGAETDNVGLQFLVIPDQANTLFPAGTRFADYANVHNYVSGVHPGYVDNQAWQAADPILNGNWDGLYKGYGSTWLQHFKGYSDSALKTLPRVTTETGWDAATEGEERTQGIVLVNTYLAQFKRGWRYTFIYELGDGEGGEGHQGLFHADWTPKLAANYIHNLTTILNDDKDAVAPGQVAYSIPDQPKTVHDLLLQKSSGTFDLVIWGEAVQGTKNVLVNLGEPRRMVKIYDTTVGSSPIRELTDTDRVTLEVSDHALIVEF